MIKKSIVYIEKIVKEVLADKSEAFLDETEKSYLSGSIDVAENVINGLEDLKDLFSVYTLNPYPKSGADRWEEIACTTTADNAQGIAEGIVLLHKGQIDIRYEGACNMVFEVKLEGRALAHYPLKEAKK